MGTASWEDWYQFLHYFKACCKVRLGASAEKEQSEAWPGKPSVSSFSL